MKRILVAFGLALSCFVLAVTMLPLQAAVPSATTQYLKNQPRDAWTMMALRAAQVEGLDASALTVDGLTTPTDIQKAILGVVAANGNPFSIKNQNLVSQLDNTRRDRQIGEPELINDDIFGLLAYLAAGVVSTDDRIKESKAFLVANQNADGGFGFAVGQPSDTNITAMALMALLGSGLPVNDMTNQNALDYLFSAQNSDGGFGYAVQSESDAASTSWVITALRAAGIDANKLAKNGQTPYAFLASLAMPDGSYKWKTNDTRGSVIMTVYAAIALSDHTYPVAFYQGQQAVNKQPVGSPTIGSQPFGPVPDPTKQTPLETKSIPSSPVLSARNVHYRIEGRHQQLCQGETVASTPFDVLAHAAVECGFTYIAEQTSQGVYVKQVGADTPENTMGWLYLINWKQPQAASDQQPLAEGDYVTWFYGDPSWTPLWMEFTYAPGIAWTLNPTHHVIVREYRQGTWHAVSDATVWAGGTTVQTNEQGMAFIPSRLDTRWFFAYKNGHVRSHGYHVTGQESVTVDVVLRSTPPKKIQTEQDSGSFIVYSPASTNYGIDFGTLDRGQTASHVFVVENTSNAPLTLSQVSLGYLRSSVTARVNDVPLHEFRASIEPGHRIEFRVAITANERVENVDFGKLAFVVTK